jgi:enoyl-CoA hydratase/carnithine racemase
MDGITRGGGMGLAQGAALRIVGERTRVAMPEVAIGFFPDVGGSYFLSRLPGALGPYLALTGLTIRAADTLYCGLADVQIAAAARLEPALRELDWHDPHTPHDPRDESPPRSPLARLTEVVREFAAPARAAHATEARDRPAFRTTGCRSDRQIARARGASGICRLGRGDRSGAAQPFAAHARGHPLPVAAG